MVRRKALMEVNEMEKNMSQEKVENIMSHVDFVGQILLSSFVGIVTVGVLGVMCIFSLYK